MKPTRSPGAGTGLRPTPSTPVELLLCVLVPCRAREPDQHFGATSLETSKKKAGESPAEEDDAQTTRRFAEEDNACRMQPAPWPGNPP